MKKKFLLFILASLFAITQDAWASVAKTPQVIWCNGNNTLYFINSSKLYAAGNTYDGQTISRVWSGTDVTASPTNADPAFNFYACDYCTTVVFDESFASVRPTSCAYWFDWFTELTTIEGIENLNTSEVTSMRSMFSTCSKLTSLDLSNFNTANVTNMD
ncbi:MAG: BspA family leucine-rich repeat surface protein, partial [Prevotella sp.]|nr:BspA family leucine-rich repeat surface protein [Prevotella sp.]